MSTFAWNSSASGALLLALSLGACSGDNTSSIGSVPQAVTCIDYEDFPHVIGAVELSTSPFALATSMSSQSIAYVADGEAGLQVIDFYSKEHPTIVGGVRTRGPAVDVAAAPPDFALVADGDLRIVSFDTPSSRTIIDLDTPGNATAVAWSDSPDGSYTYIGDSGYGLLIVKNLASPTIVGHVDIPDYIADVAVQYPYAYVTTVSGLLVVDITPPSSPRIVGRDEDVRLGLHVTPSGNYAYQVGLSSLHVIDVVPPAHPMTVANLWGLFGISIHGGNEAGLVVDGSLAFLAAGAIQFIDVTAPTHPQVVGKVSAEHAVDIAVEGRYGYVAANDWAGEASFEVLDLASRASPKITGTAQTEGFGQGLAVDGSHAYVADGRYGLTVIDISTPFGPRVVSKEAEQTNAAGVAIAGPYAYVTYGSSGLHVLDITTPSHPVLVGGAPLSGFSSSIVHQDSLIFVTTGPTMEILKLLSPSVPVNIGHVDAIEYAFDVAVSGAFAYVADESAGIHVIDISQPSLPTVVGSVATSRATGIAVAGSTVYVADWLDGLVVIDVSNPANPTIVGNVDTPGLAYRVRVAGSYAYVGGNLHLDIVDVRSPTNPVAVGVASIDGFVGGIVVDAPHVYVAASDFVMFPSQCE